MHDDVFGFGLVVRFLSLRLELARVFLNYQLSRSQNNKQGLTKRPPVMLADSGQRFSDAR